MQRLKTGLPRWCAIVFPIVLIGFAVFWFGIREGKGLFSFWRPAAPPNVFIIMVDTLRPDYLGTYGFEGDISPNLDAFAAESVKFTNAFSHSPWTRPSVATLFTSLYPQTHLQSTNERGVHSKLPDDVTTLAESLKTAGYETAAFAAQSWVDPRLGLAQGFDHFEQHVGFFQERTFSGIPLVLGMENWLRGLWGEAAPSSELDATIVSALGRFANPRLLVWGVPDNAEALCEANAGGATVFVHARRNEASDTLRKRGCTVVSLEYTVSQKEAFRLLDKPSSLTLDLPAEVLDEKFDVIVVSALRPGEMGPSRMKPIFMSAQLSSDDSHVFVGNYERTVEATYADRFLFPKFGRPGLVGKQPLTAHFSRTPSTLASSKPSDAVGPLFMYFHFIDVHGSYRCNEEDFRAVAKSPTLGSERRITPAEKNLRPVYLGAAIDWWDAEMSLDLRNWKTCYAAGTRRFDRLFGRLVERLEALGIYENSVTIVIADHGEEFLEQGRWHHGSALNSQQLRIPMLIRLPRREHAGLVVDRMTGLVDVMPTVLSLAGVELSAQGGLEGSDLSRTWSGAEPPEPGSVFATGIDGKGALSTIGLFEEDYAAVWNYPDGHLSLFKPAEGGAQHERVRNRKLARKFKAKLTKKMKGLASKGTVSAETTTLDEETVDDLKSLGYLQ
jgi:hypothetical protein